MVRPAHDFKQFSRLLNSRAVESPVVGGYAIGFHGYLRANTDPDIRMARPSSDAANVEGAAREFRFEVPGVRRDISRFGCSNQSQPVPADAACPQETKRRLGMAEFAGQMAAATGS